MIQNSICPVFRRPNNWDDAVHYLTHLLFGRLHIFVLKYDTYTKGEKFYELNMVIQLFTDLPAVFCDL